MEHKVIVCRCIAGRGLRRHEDALHQVKPLCVFENAGINVPISRNNPWALDFGKDLSHYLEDGQILLSQPFRMDEPDGYHVYPTSEASPHMRYGDAVPVRFGHDFVGVVLYAKLPLDGDGHTSARSVGCRAVRQRRAQLPVDVARLAHSRA